LYAHHRGTGPGILDRSAALEAGFDPVVDGNACRWCCPSPHRRADAEQALAAIAKERPDLILMDIQLPIMDGYTATRQIKGDPALRSIPIIAVTSYALSGEDKKARAAGCDDYVPKPFSPRQLLAKIRQYMPE
jgi:two-component system cell cycle response regulator DivK